MVLTGGEAEQPVRFGLRQPFAEPLAGTAGRAPRWSFEQWVGAGIGLAPDLPKAFESQSPSTCLESISHCAVLMLPPSRWADGEMRWLSADAARTALVGARG